MPEYFLSMIWKSKILFCFAKCYIPFFQNSPRMSPNVHHHVHNAASISLNSFQLYYGSGASVSVNESPNSGRYLENMPVPRIWDSAVHLSAFFDIWICCPESYSCSISFNWIDLLLFNSTKIRSNQIHLLYWAAI